MKSHLKSITRTCLAFGLAIGLFASCSYDTFEVPEIIVVEEVSYVDIIVPIFEAKCNSCHGGAVAPDLSPGVGYDNLINFNYINTQDPASSLLYTKIEGNGSMEQYANDQDRTLILQWITEGAKDN